MAGIPALFNPQTFVSTSMLWTQGQPAQPSPDGAAEHLNAVAKGKLSRVQGGTACSDFRGSRRNAECRGTRMDARFRSSKH